jgi:protease IV
MSSAKPSQWAMALLGLVLLSLIVGLWQASSQAQLAAETEKSNAAASHHSGSSVLGRAGKLFKTANDDHLITLKLRGVITSEGDKNDIFDSDSTAIQTRKALDDIANDPHAKGVLLLIDSPGGSVAMSQELNAAVKRVSAKMPVVASLGDVAASGGYYTAVAADKIVANPGTLTASIGVIIHSMNAQELMEKKLGVKPVTIKSGKFKDILSPYRPPTADETALLQAVVDDSYQDFLGAVLAGRLKSVKDPAARQQREQAIRALADGRVVLGVQALKAGLVDEIGDGYHAEQTLQALAQKRFNLSDAKLDMIDYSKTKDVLSLFGMGASTGLAHVVQFLVPAHPSLESQVVPYSARHTNQPLWIME